MIMIYNSILFDDVVEGDVDKGEPDWSQVCQLHREQVDLSGGLAVLPGDITSEGYICGVKGCAEIASYYISFPDKGFDEINLNISINRKDLIDQGYDSDFLTDEAKEC